MDHKTAESLLSVDKYILDELSAQERIDFEQHLDECPICSEQVRQNFTVIENLKEVLREEKEKATSKDTEPLPRVGWRDWLRLPSLVPTFAALAFACLLAYQHFGGATEITEVARALPAPMVIGTVQRGDAVTNLVDRKFSTFILNFDVESSRPDSFVCEFKSADGKKVLTIKTPLEATSSLTLPVQLPSKEFPAGPFEMLLRPASEPDRIKTYPFVIEDSK